MRIALLHNPASGGSPSRRRLVKLIESYGHEVRYHSSREHGDEAIRHEDVDLVLIAGGDGTTAKAFKLLGARVRFALLPVGTANNIASSLGVEGSHEEILSGLGRAREVRLDVGTARAPWEETRFVESAGVGLFAALLREATYETTQPRKEDPELDPIAWARHKLRGLLQRVAARRCAIVVDGHDLSGDYLMAAAMNISYIGPRLGLAPGATSGDGLLELVLVREEDRVVFATWLDDLLHGKREAFPIVPRQGKRIEMEWSGAAGHLDDEAWPKPEVRRANGTVVLEIDSEPVRVLV